MRLLSHLLLASFVPVVGLAQQQTDSTGTQPPPAPQIDRYVIDVSAVMREGGTARTVSDVLTSQVPGLLVVPGSGLNGAGARVRFVGVRSPVADVAPLILLDGMRIDAREDDSELLAGEPGPSRLDDIPIEEIQSIEVLHGPSSTAMYGLGAAAGVILIRTKAGRSGPVRVEGFAHGGTRSVPSHWPANYGGVDLDNADALIQRGGCSLITQAAGLCVQDFVQSFNPLVDRSPFTTAPYRAGGLSATGGTASLAFRAAGKIDGDGAAFDVPAVTWPNDVKNWNLRAGASAHPTRKLDIDASVARISHTLRLPMYAPVLGALLGPSDSSGFSWDSIIHGNSGTQELGRTLASLNVQVRPLRWLRLGGQLGFDDLKHDELQGVVGQAWTTGQRIARNHTFAFNANAPNLSWLGIRFTTTLGIERVTNREDVRHALLTTGSYSIQTTRSRMNSTGVYAIEQVGMRDRLFVTGTLRHNGVDHFSALSATNRSLALDWIARPERQGLLGGVVLHAAYGWAVQPPPPLIGLALPLLALQPLGQPISPFKPDNTRELELRAEASGFGHKWHAQASVYDLRSYASEYIASASSSIPGIAKAEGTISNRGATASLSGTLIDRGSIGWDVRLSVWGNRNRLAQQQGREFAYNPFGGGGVWTGQLEKPGVPLNGYWSRPVLSFSDANADGIITTDEVIVASSFQWAGTPYPTQGAMVTSSWRLAHRVHVSATLDYRAGQTLLNQTGRLRCVYQLCRESNDPATSLAAQATAVAAAAYPVAYFEDADYLKLRELSVSLDLPERVASAFGARSGAVMVGGRDLVTWTRYSGADPETASYGRQDLGSPMSIGDFATVPVQPLWMLRVRLLY